VGSRSLRPAIAYEPTLRIKVAITVLAMIALIMVVWDVSTH
jgi:hypothetical protein